MRIYDRNESYLTGKARKTRCGMATIVLVSTPHYALPGVTRQIIKLQQFEKDLPFRPDPAH